MTGRDTPRRRISSRRVNGYKLDADAAASYFRQRMAFSTASPVLDPDILIKAIGPNLKSNGSSPGRAGKSNPSEDLLLPKFDPAQKRKPGQVLKLHVTYDDLIKNPDGPHFGWVDALPELSPEKQAQSLQQAFYWRGIQPEVLVPMINGSDVSEQTISAKALGRTLREMNPRGVIDLAAAIARGVIVDADGKMRCPPGTPNANQFTDEFMTNCMSAPEGRGRIARRFQDVAARLQQLEMEGRNIRLQRTANQRLQKAKENHAAPQEVADSAAARNERINEVLSELGVSLDSTFNGDYTEALLKLDEMGLGPSIKGLFSGGAITADGQPFIWDDSQSTLENLTRYNSAVEASYENLLVHSLYGRYAIASAKSGKTPLSFEEFKDQIKPEQLESIRKQIPALVERHQGAMRGYMGALIDIYKKNPENLKKINRVRAWTPGDEMPGDKGLASWWSTEGITIPITSDVDGGPATEIAFNPYSLTMQPFQEFISKDGGLFNITTSPEVESLSEQERSERIADALANINDGVAFLNELDFANMITASRMKDAGVGASFTEIRAQHIAFHEFGHVLHYDLARQKVYDMAVRDGEFILYDLDKNGMPIISGSIKGHPDTWSNDQWASAVDQAIGGYLGPGDFFPPINAALLEESMTHLLSGQYYQNEIAAALSLDPTDPARMKQVKQAVFEASTEIYAMREMGILRGDDIDKVTSWMDEETPNLAGRGSTAISRSQPSIDQEQGTYNSEFIPLRTPTFVAKLKKQDEDRRLQEKADQAREADLVDDVLPNLPTSPDGKPLDGKRRQPQASQQAQDLIDGDNEKAAPDWASPRNREQLREASDGMFDFDKSEGAGLKYEDMTTSMIDARSEKLRETLAELKNRGELEEDQQKRLYIAAREMEAIIDINNARRDKWVFEPDFGGNRDPEKKPGKYISRRTRANKTIETDESIKEAYDSDVEPVIMDKDDLRAIRGAVKKHQDQRIRNRETGPSLMDIDSIDAEKQDIPRQDSVAASSRRIEMETAHSRIPENGVKDVLLGDGIGIDQRYPEEITLDGDLSRVINEYSQRRAQLEVETESDDIWLGNPTPQQLGVNLSHEVNDVLLPSLEQLDKSVIREDIDVTISIQAPEDGFLTPGEIIAHGVKKTKTTSPEQVGDVPDDDATIRVNLKIRSGDKGLLGSSDGESVDLVTLPPGSIGITDVAPDGTVTAFITKQKKPSDVARSMLERLEQVPVTDANRKDIDRLKQVLSKKIDVYQSSEEKRPRGVASDPASDKVVRTKNIAVQKQLELERSRPFNPTAQFVDEAVASNLFDGDVDPIFGELRTKDQIVLGNRTRVSEVAEKMSALVDGSIDPADDIEYEVSERLRQLGDVDIEKELSDALRAFADSVSDQSRMSIDLDEMDSLMRDPSFVISPASRFSDGTDNPFYEFKQRQDLFRGFSESTDPSLRPMEVDLIHDGDIKRINDYLESLPPDGLIRSADFYSDSTEASVHLDGPRNNPIELIISPTASDRTGMTINPDRPLGMPSQLTGSSNDDLISALMPIADQGESDSDAMLRILDIIEQSRSGDADISSILLAGDDGRKLTGLITGGVSQSDIEAIRVPIDSIITPNEPATHSDFGFETYAEAVAFLDDLIGSGNGEELMSAIVDGKIEVESLRLMQMQRKAAAVSQRYNPSLPRLILTNQEGVNLLDRNSFSGFSYVSPSDDIDQILVKRNRIFLNQNAEKLLDAARGTRPSINMAASPREMRGSLIASGMRSSRLNAPTPDIQFPEVDDIQPDPGEYANEVVDAARRLRGKMNSTERSVTESLVNVAAAYDGKMEGLEFRLKATKGLAKKISNYMSQGMSLEEATSKVKDSLRYTMSLDEEQYVMGMFAALKNLQTSGHEVAEIKNYWDDGDAYQGINIVMKHPDGFLYELQFHTPISFEVKQANHSLYDDFQKETEPEKRYDLFMQMSEAAMQIPKPSGDILSIGTRIFEPFQKSLADMDFGKFERTQKFSFDVISNKRKIVGMQK